jgi:hypothetical protein
MNSYEKIYTLLIEAKSGDLATYIASSPYRAMSGGTRAHMKELKAIKKRAKKKGGKEVGTKKEGDTFDVIPKTFRGSVRRARKAKKKGQRKKFLSSVHEKKE